MREPRVRLGAARVHPALGGVTEAWPKTDSLLHRDSTRTGGTTMTFSDAISSGFRNYVGFSGRASRSEFWYWILFTVLVSIVATIIDLVVLSSNTSVLSTIWSLATFLPSLAIGVRRLHDTDRSGWWWLIAFIPL